MYIESVILSNHLIICCLFSFFLQSFLHQGLFQWVSSLHQVAKVLELQHEYFQWILRLISFKIDWFHLLAVQRTLKSLLQHHSSKASILQHSAFFTIQISHPHMTTGKTIALTRQVFVGKVMSLLFNMLSSLVISFLPRSKCLLMSLLQSPLVIANTLFQQHKRRLYTWTSPDDQHRNQIDYIFCSQRWESLYSQQKQDQEVTVAQIISSLLPNSDLKWKK